ncbi:uncharacterized protein LOC121467849 [Drosophila elegans]|uniref:uncharacterized protein LOC121467849 n=1 Tax=Drosophila elegans TaxID=30023 RepID=UPI001BC8387A|nr:uncharacterized protein LOC121467849 [Drosophila elegans]
MKLLIVLITLLIIDFGVAQWHYQWQWMGQAKSSRTSCDWNTGRYKCSKESCTHSFDGKKECSITEVPAAGFPAANNGYIPNSGIGGAIYESHGSTNYEYGNTGNRGHSSRRHCRTHNGIQTCIYQRCTFINGKQECFSSESNPSAGSTGRNEQVPSEYNVYYQNFGNSGPNGTPSKKSEISHAEFPGRFN